jgi:hypothetical protein
MVLTFDPKAKDITKYNKFSKTLQNLILLLFTQQLSPRQNKQTQLGIKKILVSLHICELLVTLMLKSVIDLFYYWSFLIFQESILPFFLDCLIDWLENSDLKRNLHPK